MPDWYLPRISPYQKPRPRSGFDNADIGPSLSQVSLYHMKLLSRTCLYVVTRVTSTRVTRFTHLVTSQSTKLRGLCRRSYFGPRTSGGSINHFSLKCSGFLIRVSPSHPYWGRCNAIVPLHLPDALEYNLWLWMERLSGPQRRAR